MKIHVMKVFHWANGWPEDYLNALDSQVDRKPCRYGHEECSMCKDGSCREEVKSDQSSD